MKVNFLKISTIGLFAARSWCKAATTNKRFSNGLFSLFVIMNIYFNDFNEIKK